MKQSVESFYFMIAGLSEFPILFAKPKTISKRPKIDPLSRAARPARLRPCRLQNLP